MEPSSLNLPSLTLYDAAMWILVAILISFIIYGFHPILRWKYRHIPGPPVRWLVGCLPEIARCGAHNVYSDFNDTYGDEGVFKVFWGAHPVVIVTEPTLIKKVLAATSHRYRPPFAVPHEKRVFKNHMLLANGADWKEMRSVWTPFFSQQRLENYLPKMQAPIHRLCQVLDGAADEKKVFDLWPAVGMATFDVIATAAAGIPIETLKKSDITGNGSGDDHPVAAAAAATAPLGEQLATSMRLVIDSSRVGPVEALLFLIPGLKWVLKPLVILFRFRVLKIRAKLFKIYSRLVNSVRNEDPSVVVDKNSFLATVSTVRDAKTGKLKPQFWPMMQTHLFLLAGFETTATAVSYAIYFLSLNKDKEEKVLEEIDRFGRDRVPSSLADLEELVYLKAVFNEALRLLPPGPFTTRQAVTDIQVGPYSIPKGSWIHGVLYTMQRSEKSWKHALEFQPERFLLDSQGNPLFEEYAALKNNTFMPFGEGARRCPGGKLAIEEAVLTLLMLYQKYTFRLLPGQEPLKLKSGVTMTPKEGIYITVQKRE